jgi:predicted lipid-binding transport protein (Tim44 family)
MNRALWSVLTRRLWWLAPPLVLLGSASLAFARVGGGQSYSGGGGGGGGGGSGDNGGLELLLWILLQLVRLTVDYPLIGIPLDILNLAGIIAGLYYYGSGAQPRTTYSFHQDRIRGDRRITSSENALDTLREHDPNFSTILFQDFAYALYATAQQARGRKDLQTYSPYISPQAIEALQKRNGPGLTRVRGVIVAAARIVNVSDPDAKKVAVTVEFEANYTEVYGERETAWYVREQWRFSRGRDVLSRPPETITALHCPKCGGALEKNPDGSCKHCGVKITGGDFDWYVVSGRLLSREDKGPLLTTTVAESGTDLSTIYHPDLAARRARFLALNPDFDWAALQRRVRHIFLRLQQSWSDRTWDEARPYVSDRLFQMLEYWITEYRRQHLRNVLEDVHVGTLELAKVTTDAFYDAITFRIYASMRDYTTDEQGKFVCGDKNAPRRFSEYWTFIRRRGVNQKAKDDQHCPNCGALLKVNMAGVCEYCRGKITSGEFDWVLSRIEQDEAYEG